MGLTLIVTNAGRAALVNAANTGTAPVTVSQVGLTGTAVTPDATATALPGEFKRIVTLSGDVVADDTIHLIVRDESSDVFTVRSLALYLADGTLFAIYGQADVLLEKSAQALMLLAIDVQFADFDATDLTFGDANFLNPPATTEVQGVVELATLAEAIAGVDTTRVPAAKMVKDAVYSWLDSRFGVNNSGIWNPANDGAGSGLDADLLDGVQGSDYARISQPNTFTSAGINLFSGTVESRVDLGFKLSSASPYIGFFAADRASRSGYIQAQTATGAFTFHNDTAGANTNLRTTGGGAVQINGNTAWHAGNDGAGSGLDADLWDGNQFTTYLNQPLLTSSSVRFGQIATASAGSLGTIIWGSQAAIPSGNTLGGIFTLDSVTGAVAGSIGLIPRQTVTASINFYRYNGTLDLTLRSDGVAEFTNTPQVGGSAIWHAGNDGAGSGLDADMLDGMNSSAFAQLSGAAFTGNISTTGTLRVTGAGGFNIGTVGGAARLDYVSGAFVFRDSSGSLEDVSLATLNAAAATVGGGAVWTAANDGSGSGLDADLLDGAQRTMFAELDASNIFTANQVISKAIPQIRIHASDQAVNEKYWLIQSIGTTFRINAYEDALSVNSTPLSITRSGTTITSIAFAGTALTHNGSTVWTAANDGAGSGLDADLLDGQQGSYYLAASSYTAGDVKTKLLTVDGAGSGVDADLLDGQQGSYYLAASGYTAADVKAKLLTVDGSGSGIDADLLDGMHASALLPTGSLNATGYCSLPNGLILQWGTVSCAANAYGSITFPIVFTTGCFYIDSGVATELGNADAQANGPQPYNASTTGADLWNAAPAATAWWIALGK